MKEIFKTIRDTAAAVPGIRWVDFDLGQLDTSPPPVSYPCVLVGFTSGDYTLLAQDANTGTVNVEAVLAFRLRERTHSVAPESFSDEALEHIDLIEAVRIALTGLEGDTFTGLEYRGFSKDRRADLRVWRLRFACEHYPAPPESPFKPLPDGVSVGLCLDVEINQ
ncbi:MAG: hypothetical protein EPGJADBJ_04463 [Saprospiraceae bacterium]|nr:hypothetical protein [Saprospiraceae bacterium]